MTALPYPPGRLLSVAEFAALGEDDGYRWELQEGNLVMAPSPTPRHMVAMAKLFNQIEAQLPAEFRAVPDIDLDLQLAPPDQPGSSRRPDLVVVRRTEFDRVARDGGLLAAANTVLIVEIMSPGSRRTDQRIKRAEYADAGIPFYWMLDLDRPVSVTACHLAGELGYHDSGPVTATFVTAQPVPLRLDLTALV